MILTSHAEINIPPESHFFLWLFKKYHAWDIRSNLDTYLSDLFDCTKFETWELDKNELKLYIQIQNPQNYSELNKTVYKFYGKNIGKENALYWGDKNSLWADMLSSIKVIYP
jgi:hypothetical protein